MFAGRPASVWRSRSLPILIFLQLFHSSIQLGSCRPLAPLGSPNLQLPSSPVLPASCASCNNKGKFIWARGAAVLGSPIEISIVLHLFWSAGEFSVPTLFLDLSEITYGFLAKSDVSRFRRPFVFLCNIERCGIYIFLINRSITVMYSLNEGMKVKWPEMVCIS